MTKKIVKKVSKVVKKPSKKSTEHSILEDSMQVIQKLGNEVKSMAKAKDFLKEEINKLDKKISKKETTPSNFIAKLKDEIIQDFEPVFKKINPNNIKNQIKDEILKIIEIETSKIKSEINSKTTKSTRDLTQKLSSLESQILDSISTSNKISKEFDKLKKTDILEIKLELEKIIHSSIEKLNNKYFELTSKNNLEIEELKKILKSQKSQLTKLKNSSNSNSIEENKEISKIQSELKKHEKELLALAKYIDDENQVESKDITKINSKINLLEKNNKSSIKQLDFIKSQILDLTDRINILKENPINKNDEDLAIRISAIDKELNKFKNEIKKDLKIDANDLGAINSKILKLEKEFKAINSLVQKFEDKLYEKIQTESTQVENKVKDLLKKTENKFKEVQNEKQDSKKYFASEIKNIKIEIDNFENKIKTLESQNKDIILEDLENKLNELKSIIQNIEQKTTKSFEIIEKEKIAQKDLLIKEYNKIAKSLELLESKYENVAKVELKNLKQELEKQVRSDFEEFKKQISQFDNSRESEVKTTIKQLEKINNIFLKDIQKKYEDLNNFVEQKITKTIKSYKSDKSNWENKITTFKLDLSKLAQKHFANADNQLNKIKDESNKLSKTKEEILSQLNNKINEDLKLFDIKLEETTVKVNSLLENLSEEKRKETIYLKDKANELIDKFTNLSLENEAHLSALGERFAKDLEEKLNQTHKTITEKLAKDILNNNEFLSRIKLENKEDKRAFKEDIENKFVNAKLQFEESFLEHLNSFDTVLKEKEKEFSNKIKDVYNEKEALIIELSSFKDEVGILTKNYVSKLDEELQKLKTSEINFESEKTSFFTHIDNLVQAKKLELQDYGQNIEMQIYELLKNQKETFNKNENSFREIFNEKIANLREYQEKKLDSIEKKFVDKNLKYVKDKIDSQLEYLNLFDQKLESKEEEIIKHLEILEDSKNMLHEEFTGEFSNLNEKVEQRLTNAEKQFNKRFIDYDSTITQFKSVVIDEVEGLMREINQLTSDKLSLFDNSYLKLDTLSKTVTKNLEEIKHAKLILDKEFKNIRDELNDLRVGFESATHLKLGGMNNLVQNMTEYENQLIDLVQSLKAKGVSNQNILNALINKGHPRMYATMIINNLDQILLK